MHLKSKFLIPPGGWYFLNNNVKIEEQTYEELVNSVKKHRINNKLPSGNVEFEVNEQICERWGNGCECY